ncbi:IS3 family transposase [Brevibacillus massiliensis]|uniref:IS3 family transposase n=1 Tax=Brevibacillus massiliensis TaxID=1118054 RepID=UPI0011CBE5BE|nr:IS3 family transposase [Brevibacillus massiliensis]
MLGNLETGGVKGKYAIIEELSVIYPITQLCEALGVWRSAFYRHLERKKQNVDSEIKQQIQSIYEQRGRIYGYRRIRGELARQYGIVANHKKVLRLMREPLFVQNALILILISQQNRMVVLP